jgi:hypothetical protein
MNEKITNDKHLQTNLEFSERFRTQVALGIPKVFPSILSTSKSVFIVKLDASKEHSYICPSIAYMFVSCVALNSSK